MEGGEGARESRSPTPHPSLPRRQLVVLLREQFHGGTDPFVRNRCGNDPSAGSPTETLLRLHLPLNDEV